MGKITFEIQRAESEGFTLNETIKIRYVRQDNTDEDAASIEAWDEYFS